MMGASLSSSATACLIQAGGDVELDVLVVPRASRSEILGVVDGRLRVRLTAPPVDGKANKALVQLVAKAVGVSKSSVTLASGQTGRRKRLRVAGVRLVRVRDALGLQEQ